MRTSLQQLLVVTNRLLYPSSFQSENDTSEISKAVGTTLGPLLNFVDTLSKVTEHISLA